MKITLKTFAAIAALAAAMVSCGTSEEKKCTTPLAEEMFDLNYPVKSLEQREYMASGTYGNVCKGDLQWSETVEFNGVGNPVRLTVHGAGGNVVEEYTHIYDADGNVIGQYDELNQYHRIRFEYNDEGKQTRGTVYDENGGIESYDVTEYEGGYPAKDVSVRNKPDSVSVRKVVSEKLYKRDGEVISETYQYEDSVLVKHIKYSRYDIKGIVEGVEYDGDSVKIKDFYTRYNDEGEMVEKRSHDYIYGIDSEYKEERNDKGHLIHKYESEGGYEFETYYEYEYDSNGNWIERVEYAGAGKNPRSIVERDIKY